jgi:hypothetical protein
MPPTFMLIYGLITNDMATITLSPTFLAGMAAIVGAVTLIKKSVRKREKK